MAVGGVQSTVARANIFGLASMERKTAMLSVIAASLYIAACADRPEMEAGLTEVCRPIGVEPAELTIGELTVPRDQLVAQLQHSPITGAYGVSISLSEQYARSIARATRENLGQTLAVRLDDEVVAEPVVNTPILDGRVLITGNYTRTAASDIVARLSGPCPVADRD
ncbi:MAG: hypothetical protein AAGI03_05765 [Pseudomonadota bacterium]